MFISEYQELRTQPPCDLHCDMYSHTSFHDCSKFIILDRDQHHESAPEYQRAPQSTTKCPRALQSESVPPESTSRHPRRAIRTSQRAQERLRAGRFQRARERPPPRNCHREVSKFCLLQNATGRSTRAAPATPGSLQFLAVPNCP